MKVRIGQLSRIARVLSIAALLSAILASVGCGGAISGTNSHANGDPLGLGVVPGPLGSTAPQMIQVRAGSEPNDRIVSLALTINSMQTTNSGSEQLDLLSAPVTVEFAHSAVVTEPVVIRQIYQDTYSNLILPAMTGQVVFYDSNGNLATQALNIDAQTITFSPQLVLAGTPQVLSVSLDLAQTFSVGESSVAVNSPVFTTRATAPAPAVSPAVGQPETGSVNFLVGTVTSDVSTTNHVIALQPGSGNAFTISYDENTTFVNCSPSMLNGMMIEVDGATQLDGSVLASQVALVDNSTLSSQLTGIISGYAPDGINYNLIDQGGLGVNTATGLIGSTISVDWSAASYSVNHGRIPASLSLFDESAQDHLVLAFDSDHVFPGQAVAAEWGSLIVPDPDSSNAGLIQPGMFELEEQTITGQVSNYQYDSTVGLNRFTLTVASTAPIMRMNPGLTAITVYTTSTTYLRNLATITNGAAVKVRGLLFVHPDYNNAGYLPGNPVAFVLVADRVSN